MASVGLLGIGLIGILIPEPSSSCAGAAISVEALIALGVLTVVAQADEPIPDDSNDDDLKDAAAEAAKGGLGDLGRAGKGKGVREVVGDSGDARKLFDDLRGFKSCDRGQTGRLYSAWNQRGYRDSQRDIEERATDGRCSRNRGWHPQDQVRGSVTWLE